MARFDCSNSGPYLVRLSKAVGRKTVVRPGLRVPEITEEVRALVRGWIQGLPDDLLEAEQLEEADLPFDDFAAYYADKTGESLNAFQIRQVVALGRRATLDEVMEAARTCILEQE